MERKEVTQDETPRGTPPRHNPTSADTSAADKAGLKSGSMEVRFSSADDVAPQHTVIDEEGMLKERLPVASHRLSGSMKSEMIRMVRYAIARENAWENASTLGEEDVVASTVDIEIKKEIIGLFNQHEETGRSAQLEWVWAALLPPSVVVDVVFKHGPDRDGQFREMLKSDNFRAHVIVGALELPWERTGGDPLEMQALREVVKEWAAKLSWAADFGNPEVFEGLLEAMLLGSSEGKPDDRTTIEDTVRKVGFRVRDIIDEADDLYWNDGIHLARNDSNEERARGDLMMRAAKSGSLCPNVHDLWENPTGEHYSSLNQGRTGMVKQLSSHFEGGKLMGSPRGDHAEDPEEEEEEEIPQAQNPVRSLLRFLLERRWGNKTCQPNCEPVQLLVTEAMADAALASPGHEAWKVRDDPWWWDSTGFFQGKVVRHISDTEQIDEAKAVERFEDKMYKTGTGVWMLLDAAMERRRKRFLPAVSFLLSWGCHLRYRYWSIHDVLETLNISQEEITNCLIDSITMARNPFIPALTVYMDLKENLNVVRDGLMLKTLQDEVYRLVDALLLEMPKTRNQFRIAQKRGEYEVHINTLQEMLEPEGPQELDYTGPFRYAYDNPTRSLLFEGPLFKAINSRNLAFMSAPLLLDYVMWRFNKNLPAPWARDWRVPQDRKVMAVHHLSSRHSHTKDTGVINPYTRQYAASFAQGLPEQLKRPVEFLEGSTYNKDPQKVPLTSYPALQFLMMGMVTRPQDYSNIPSMRFFLNFINYLALLIFFGVSAVLVDVAVVPWYEWVLYIFILGAVLNEITQLAGAYRRRRDYLDDEWNYIDMVMLILVTSAFSCRMVSLVRVRDGRDPSTPFDWARILLACSSPFLFARALSFTQISYHLGPTVQVFFKMLVELFRFSIILLVVLLGFSMGFYSLFSEAVEPNTSKSLTTNVPPMPTVSPTTTTAPVEPTATASHISRALREDALEDFERREPLPPLSSLKSFKRLNPYEPLPPNYSPLQEAAVPPFITRMTQAVQPPEEAPEAPGEPTDAPTAAPSVAPGLITVAPSLTLETAAPTGGGLLTPTLIMTPAPTMVGTTLSPVQDLEDGVVKDLADTVVVEIEEQQKEAEVQLFYEGFKTYETSALTIFKALVGTFDFDDFEEVKYGEAGVFLLVVYLLVVTITLLNLLIAVFTTTHAKVSARQTEEYHLTRAYIAVSLAQIIDEGHTPEPFNLLVPLITLRRRLLLACCPPFCLSRKPSPKALHAPRSPSGSTTAWTTGGERGEPTSKPRHRPLQTIPPAKSGNVWKITNDQMGVIAFLFVVGPLCLVMTALLWLLCTLWYLPFNMFESVLMRSELKRSQWSHTSYALWGLGLSLTLVPCLLVMSMVRAILNLWVPISPPTERKVSMDNEGDRRPYLDLSKHFKSAEKGGPSQTPLDIRLNKMKKSSLEVHEETRATTDLVARTAGEMSNIKKMLAEINHLTRKANAKRPVSLRK